MSWQIDPSHSEINFTVRHMMVTNVRGRFEKFSGTFDFDEKNPVQSKIEVQIDTASINTRDPQRDGHLKSPDFFEVEKYPYATFKSKRIEVVDSHHGHVVGDLTIRDATNEVVLEVEYSGQSKSPWGTTSAGFNATTTINRKDYNLTWNQSLETGGVLVGEEIKINIDIELIKQPEPAAVAA
jgi:polyisoprenoid-binding protein YceI